MAASSAAAPTVPAELLSPMEELLLSMASHVDVMAPEMAAKYQAAQAAYAQARAAPPPPPAEQPVLVLGDEVGATTAMTAALGGPTDSTMGDAT